MSNEPLGGDYDSFADFCHRDDPVYPKGKNGKFRCPCCQHYTLGEIAAYDICPVCFWEDDGTTGEHAFSPNGVTLAEARVNFKQFGAAKERSREHVRPPDSDEISSI